MLQAFIELVRRKQPLEAITYAQQYLARYRSDVHASRVGQLQKVVALLAYDNPNEQQVHRMHNTHAWCTQQHSERLTCICVS